MSGILERLETKLDILIAKFGTASVAELGEAVHQLADTHVEAPMVAEQSTATNDPYAGTDKDGVTWDARIHSKAKEPKSETTGKWKKRKGLAPGVYDTIMAELLAVPATTNENGPYFWVDTVTNVSNTCDTRAEMDELLQVATTKELTEAEFDALLLAEAPATGPKPPLAPKAPAAPLAGVPSAPAAPVANPVKTEVLNLIKELTTTFQVEPNDITGLMVEVTGFDTIGKIADDKLSELKDALTTWHDAVEAAGKAVEEMKVIADANGFTVNLNEGIEGILEPHNADRVGIVPPCAIAEVNDSLQAYLKTWQAI